MVFHKTTIVSLFHLGRLGSIT